MKNIRYIIPFLAMGVLSSCATAQSVSLGDKETIVFLGDSITAAGARPNGYVTLTGEDIKKAYPDKEITVIGAGISGHKVPNCQERLERDVLKKNPSLVIIYIGINDVWHWKRNKGTPKDQFESGLADLVTRCQHAGARVILCTPTVIGEKTDGSNKFDDMLDEYSAISRKVAEQTKAQLLDLRQHFKDYLKAHNSENIEKGVLTGDGVHLNPAGNRFLADLMLKALGVSPSN
jgi:lysophospholipase L1-like esterase